VAAPSGQLKTRPYFMVLGILIALIYTLVFATGDHKPKPKLGLDLVGGTQITMKANTVGKAPTRDQMEVARQIINQRVDANGVSEAEVVISGADEIQVSVPGQGQRDTLNKLLDPAKLEFRAVLSSSPDTTVVPEPTASPSPSGSGGLTPSAPVASGSPSAKPSASPSTSASTTVHGDAIAPSSSPSATPPKSPSSSPSAPASSPPASPTATPSAIAGAPTLAEVKAKLAKISPDAYAIASGLTSPSGVTDQAMYDKLKPFSTLTADEVAVLPAVMQFSVPTISCIQLNGRNSGYLTDDDYLKQKITACDDSATAPTKFQLDVAKVKGTDVDSASAVYDLQQFTSTGWGVQLNFKSSGQQAWTQLTQDAKNAEAQDGSQHAVAITLDAEVISAPNIISVISGPATISGAGIDDKVAHQLANQLKFGALPMSFEKQNGVDVSATLGLQQLKSGLLAGAIGLVLVVVYCLVYYRALGLVVIASLIVSAALVFGSLVLLGRSMGFTLSLAGIAGFIVAVGITADSFVVFFERLKDEVKEGRSVRSAVPRAWVRARRTILSADTVSLIAAAVLFFIASGQVSGFAFTLGLSTIIDLVVVFLFTHPIVSALAGTKLFTHPRMSGLGELRSAPRVASALRTKES
jgi:preprotein translocase subunit SecD